ATVPSTTERCNRPSCPPSSNTSSRARDPHLATLAALEQAACREDILCDNHRCRTTHLLTTQHNCCVLRLCDESRIKSDGCRKQGCTFEPGHGGHLIVRLGTKMSVLPMHGKQKELGTGLVNSIKKEPRPEVADCRLRGSYRRARRPEGPD